LTSPNLSKYAGQVPRGPASRDVTITLNGEPYELDEPLTLAALLERLRIDPRRVAIEHNLTVVRRAEYGEALVGDGDQVEIVNFVGGGAGTAPR
jgi:thiamine biosynthesis protein ThiS